MFQLYYYLSISVTDPLNVHQKKIKKKIYLTLLQTLFLRTVVIV